ncbi:hypothetical protein [Halobacillus trueperi]|uniref:hypothetical protein n=1 Tax=Halobacillus trueperi TaxID=156205 RepID=UPI00142DA4A9|nr:hypothetical protein [Halobacillus trueperi]
MMKFFFLLSSIIVPVSLFVDQAAAGVLAALVFLLTGAYFSKPRFRKYTNES